MDKENEEFSSNLTTQNSGLLAKINDLVQLKHYVHCYLAEIDGKVEPPVPAVITTFEGLQLGVRSPSYDTLNAGSASPNQKRGVSIFNRFSSTSSVPLTQHVNSTSPLKGSQPPRESVQNLEESPKKAEKNRGSQAPTP